MADGVNLESLEVWEPGGVTTVQVEVGPAAEEEPAVIQPRVNLVPVGHGVEMLVQLDEAATRMVDEFRERSVSVLSNFEKIERDLRAPRSVEARKLWRESGTDEPWTEYDRGRRRLVMACVSAFRVFGDHYELAADYGIAALIAELNADADGCLPLAEQGILYSILRGDVERILNRSRELQRDVQLRREEAERAELVASQISFHEVGGQLTELTQRVDAIETRTPAKKKPAVRRGANVTSRQRPTDRSAEVELLRHDDDPQASLGPVCQRRHAVLEPSAQTIELPQDDSLHAAVKDVGLQTVELTAPKRRPALLVGVPLDFGGVDTVGFEPLLDFGPLAGVVLVAGADADVGGDGHREALVGGVCRKRTTAGVECQLGIVQLAQTGCRCSMGIRVRRRPFLAETLFGTFRGSTPPDPPRRPKRRRWPWLLLLAVIVGCVGWMCRPLTTVERSLVGRWISGVVGEDSSPRLLIRSDRSYESWEPQVTPSGFRVAHETGNWMLLRKERWLVFNMSSPESRSPSILIRRTQAFRERMGWDGRSHAAPFQMEGETLLLGGRRFTQAPEP
jgi:hypothetical protein